MYIEFPYIAEQCCSLRSGSIVMIHNMAFFFSCTCSKLSRDFSRAMAGRGRLPEKWDSSTDVFARSRPLGNLWVSPATSIQNCKSDLEERRMKGGLVVVVFCCCCFGLLFFFGFFFGTHFPVHFDASESSLQSGFQAQLHSNQEGQVLFLE